MKEAGLHDLPEDCPWTVAQVLDTELDTEVDDLTTVEEPAQIRGDRHNTENPHPCSNTAWYGAKMNPIGIHLRISGT